MAALNAPTKKLIKRIEALNEEQPVFDKDKVIGLMEQHYKALGIPMPEVVIVGDLMLGFKHAESAARSAAWSAARSAAWSAAWSAGALNTGLKDAATLKFIEIELPVFEAMEAGLDYFFPMKDQLVLVPMPKLITDPNGRLHYDQGKAVQWANGEGFFFLSGIKFEEELYWRVVKQEITAEEVLNLRDSDQRMAAMALLRHDRLLKTLGAKLIHTGKLGTKLYQVDNFMETGITEYCMVMKDASTDRVFLEWVEPKIGQQKDADRAQAAAWGITLGQYLGVEQEA